MTKEEEVNIQNLINEYKLLLEKKEHLVLNSKDFKYIDIELIRLDKLIFSYLDKKHDTIIKVVEQEFPPTRF